MATVRQYPLVYYAFGFLFILAVAARLFGFYFGEGHPLRWAAAGLVALFYVLYTTERLVSERFPRYLHLYLAVQTLIGLAILLLPPHHHFSAGLGLVLSAQAVLLLPPRQSYAWIAAFTAVFMAGLIYGNGLLNGLSLGMLYVVGYLFTAAYADVVRHASTAQERSESLFQELKSAHSQLQRYAERAEELAVVEERHRLARDLHDSVVQSIYGLVLSAEAAIRRLAEGQDQLATEQLLGIRHSAQSALSEMRYLVFELRPPDLEQEGLVAALRARLESVEVRAGIETSFELEGNGRLPLQIEAGLYRVAQEALNNALKHAGADRVGLLLRVTRERVELEVTDNGCGFAVDAAGKRGGLGLRGMRERAEQLGGTLAIDSTAGAGTRVRLVLPGR